MDLREVFKFYMGYNKGNIRKILRIFNHDRTRKIEHQVFRLEPENLMFKKETGRNWFSNTVVDDWNGLSNQAVSAEAFGTVRENYTFIDGDDRWKYVGIFHTSTATCRPDAFLHIYLFLMFLCSYYQMRVFAVFSALP